MLQSVTLSWNCSFRAIEYQYTYWEYLAVIHFFKIVHLLFFTTCFGGGSFSTVTRLRAWRPEFNTQNRFQTVDLYLGVKRREREADQSPPSSTEVKNNVKLFLCFFFFLAEHHAMKAYRGSGSVAPPILDHDTVYEWWASHPGRFTPREKNPDTHWMGPRAGLDAVVKRTIPSPCRD